MGFMMQIRPEVVKKLREDYPPGAKVELIEMCDPYRDSPPGCMERLCSWMTRAVCILPGPTAQHLQRSRESAGMER